MFLIRRYIKNRSSVLLECSGQEPVVCGIRSVLTESVGSQTAVALRLLANMAPHANRQRAIMLENGAALRQQGESSSTRSLKAPLWPP